MQLIWLTPDQIMAHLTEQHPEIPDVLARVRSHVPAKKRQIEAYQAAALYALVKRYDAPKAAILEIGTFLGYSAAIMSEAAPQASIVTLNPRADEAQLARQHLQAYPNVRVIERLSWDYIETQREPAWDVIFVDGDHKQVRRDLPWWDYINPGGAFLFHDYSPETSPRPCPPVYEALNDWSAAMRHPFDVMVVDNTQVGLAGFYKGRDNA